MSSPYRPHDSGHDYYGVGTYLITLVVSGRNPLLGRLAGDAVRPEVRLSEIGEMVRDAWQSIPAKAAEHGNQVRVLACVCMPDHFHGVIEVLAPMQWCLGDIMQAFKAVCTSRWQERQGLASSSMRPISAACFSAAAPVWLQEKAARCDSEGALVRLLSKRQREEYYALIYRQQRPLFDACAAGSLLILAPWGLDDMHAVRGIPAASDFSRFHNLNHLAAEICSFQGEARIIGN